MSNSSPGGASAKSPVQSVDRAIRILEIIARVGDSGVTEIAKELHVHKSTAFRLIAALESRDLLEQNADRGKYGLGPGILRLAGAATARMDVVQEARPYVNALAAQSDETVNVAVLSAGAALYLDQVSGSTTVQSHMWIGQRIPLHATSNGRVLLSGLTREQIPEVLGESLAAYTPSTVTELSVLLDAVDKVRRDGYAVVADELEVGLTAVAAPIRGVRGDIVASLSVSGPTFRFDKAKVDVAMHDVIATADQISQRLGWFVTNATG